MANNIYTFSVKRMFSTAIMKKLFTPGPLGVSATTKEAMLRDLGSRDVEFIETIKFIRSKLLEIAGVSSSSYTAIPVQGSGTFAVESVFHSAVNRNKAKILIPQSGAYGKRLGMISRQLGYETVVLNFPETQILDSKRICDVLKQDPLFTHLAVVHCETSTGVINDVVRLGCEAKAVSPNIVYFVDAMSSFGAVPFSFTGGKIDYLVSSANKCLEGVPGFSYAICRLSHLLSCKGFSRSASLDLVDQYENFEKTKQFRFTPPTHAMLAFKQALLEFEYEGGVNGRCKRYKENRAVLHEGMRKLGFRELLDSSLADNYIITSFRFPTDPKFSFSEFYRRLNELGQVIYPGKVTEADCFRIGNIGHLFPDDMRYLLKCIETVCKDMQLGIPVQYD